MAFPNQLLSQEMGLEHFGGNDLPDNSSVLRNILSDEKASEQHRPPTWLNSAILRQPNHFEANFLNLHTNSGSSSPSPSPAPANNINQWLSRSILQRNGNVSEADGDSMMAACGDYNNNIENSREESGGWRYKAEILSHPLYEQLVSAHVACLRIATPVDQLPRIDAQLAQSQQVVEKYSALQGQGQANILGADDKDLDQFMTQYVLLLCSLKEQLQQHVRVHAMEAVMACWEIEQSLQSLTGVAPGEGTGATMSDEDEDEEDSDIEKHGGLMFEDAGNNNMNMNMNMMGSFGPLVPSESERSLMERVRQELKHELKNGYKEKIVDIREEILRKRRAGKLPGDTTSVLKAWWHSHSKWPYPTEEDKGRLVQETGLQLKQINNWFINQRKRNWHTNNNAASSSPVKSKRKRD